jgi:hypothetical protein
MTKGGYDDEPLARGKLPFNRSAARDNGPLDRALHPGAFESHVELDDLLARACPCS